MSARFPILRKLFPQSLGGQLLIMLLLALAITQGLGLLLLTDVEGVLDRNGNLIKSLTSAEAQELIEGGTISGGMIPKIESCLDVIAEGVEAVVIINGKVPHAVLLELFTEHGAGTLIERRSRKGSARSS